jgi:hypothetical protein
MAPEVMSMGQYNESSDVYSWSLICWQLLTKASLPFAQENVTWKAFREAVVQQHLRPELPADCMPSLKYLLFNCWHPDPARRPSFMDIDKHFDSILLECGLQDEYARRFWQVEFGTPLRERVTWHDFIAKFFAFLQLPPIDFARPRRSLSSKLTEVGSHPTLLLSTLTLGKH